MILDLTKTETRRLSERRPARPGVVRGFYTRPAFVKPNPGRPFCRAEILEVEREPLGAMRDLDARREGYRDVLQFSAVWETINGVGAWLAQQERLVWVVRFKVIEQLACAACGEYGDLGRLHLKKRKTASVALFCEACGGDRWRAWRSVVGGDLGHLLGAQELLGEIDP